PCLAARDPASRLGVRVLLRGPGWAAVHSGSHCRPSRRQQDRGAVGAPPHGYDQLLSVRSTPCAELGRPQTHLRLDLVAGLRRGVRDTEGSAGLRRRSSAVAAWFKTPSSARLTTGGGPGRLARVPSSNGDGGGLGAVVRPDLG